MTLSDYLAEKKVSPRDFAARIGVSPEAIRLYTKGARMPRPGVLRAIQTETAGAVTANDFAAATEPAQGAA